jgi:hypothetical protein
MDFLAWIKTGHNRHVATVYIRNGGRTTHMKVIAYTEPSREQADDHARDADHHHHAQDHQDHQ